MKVAIVTDDLIQTGGQENLVSCLSDLFPEAPIYTSIASRFWKNYYQHQGVQIKTSWLDGIPFASSINRYFSAFNLHVLAFESFNFDTYDLVFSISSRYAHCVITKPTTKHICYMNTPGRMFWDSNKYFENEQFGFLKPFKRMGRFFLQLPLWYGRIFDWTASNRVDNFIANSKNTMKRIKKYYQRDSKLVYPFGGGAAYKSIENPRSDYFLVITRLISWKKVEIAIKACENTNQNLVVVGAGPDLDRLKKISSSSVTFKGLVSETEKIDLIQNCKALINTQSEDFGIVPIEAMACGRPVIAYAAGGALETIIPGETGVFFTEQTVESLSKVIKEFDPSIYKSDKCSERAREFNKSKFEHQIKNEVYLTMNPSI